MTVTSPPISSRELKKSNRNLRVSIVSYSPDIHLLKRTILSLISASELAIDRKLVDKIDIYLVNNGPAPEHEQLLKTLLQDVDRNSTFLSIRVIGNGQNIGFGAGHNLTLDPDCSFHLILNPDVELSRDALSNALEFMNAHLDCGMLSPSVANGGGGREYLCKQYPSIMNLALRGFAPKWLREFFSERLGAYEMREKIGEQVVWDPPIISGCFMLLRNTVLNAIEGFDARYFLYFEDFDLSLRVSRVSRIAYVPSVRIVHHGGHAAKKGWRHIYLFTKSGIQFFNRHGWKII